MVMNVVEMKAPVLEVSEKIMKEVAVQAALVEEKESTFKRETKDRIAVVMTIGREDLAIQGQTTVAKAGHLQVVHLAIETIEVSMETKDLQGILETDQTQEETTIAQATSENLTTIEAENALMEKAMVIATLEEAAIANTIIKEAAVDSVDAMVTAVQALMTEEKEADLLVADSAGVMATAVQVAMKEEVEADHTVVVDSQNEMVIAAQVATKEEMIADLLAVDSADATMKTDQIVEKDRRVIAQEADSKSVMVKAVQVAKDRTTLAKEDPQTADLVKEEVLLTEETMMIDATHVVTANHHSAQNAHMASRTISRANAQVLEAMLAKAEPFPRIMN